MRRETREGLTNYHARPLTLAADEEASGAVEIDPFVADLTRLLLTFLSVVIVDLIFVSLLMHRLRFWFPVWLDPQWATRRDPWVVYSQSYFAGIFLLPILCRLVDRDFLAELGAPTRALFWSLCAMVLALLIWWKGALMVHYHKQYEMIGWAALTATAWTIIRYAVVLPERLRNVTRLRMLSGLLLGVSCFFLIMSVLDPLVQLGVQHLPWSSGLTVEVGFFIPAGFVLMMLSRRLRF